MLKRLAVLFLSILVATAVLAQAKKRIEREADIPRFTYKVDGKLEDIVRDDAKFRRFAADLRRDTESILRDYEFADNFTKLHGHHMFQMGANEQALLDD